MRKNRPIALAISAILTVGAFTSLCACDTTPPRKDEMFAFGDEYYRSVDSRYTLNYDEMMYDDFTGDSIDTNMWAISDSVWDNWGTDQNGVRPQNLFLVNDPEEPEAHLIMRANGSYYDGRNNPISEKADGVNTGAGLSTMQALGPGRYDVKMKPCPRVGALTSMWVFSWFKLDNGTIQQNEIDIELGLKPDFTNAYFTTWTSPDNNTNWAYETDYFVNDGNWHIYSFDWVTDAEVPYVDYYIDGVKVFTINTNVPTTNATLTLGVWVPSWAGGGVTDRVYNISADSRMWESDYAQFSWWRYIPFQMNNWEQRPVANRDFDPNYRVQKLNKLPIANKCANGDFERSNESYAYSKFDQDQTAHDFNLSKLVLPWTDYTVTDETDSFYVPNSSAQIVTDAVNPENHVAKIVNGGSFGQWLRGASTGFKYRITGKYRTEGNASAIFRFNNYLGYSTTSRSNGSNSFTLGSSAEWKEFNLEFTITKPETKSIRYYLEALNMEGTVYFDDISLVYLGNK